MADKHTWNERYAAAELVWSAGPNALFAEVVAGLTPGRALDLACGEGRNAIYLAECGWEVTGIDYSDVGIDKARRIAEKRGVSVDWQVADASTVELASGAFDLVAVIYLHTSAELRDHWLPKAIDAVSPGGCFLYIGHDPQNIEQGVGGPQDPSVLPSVSQLRESLENFELLRAEVFHRPVRSDPGHGGSDDVADDRVALDTLVLARRLR